MTDEEIVKWLDDYHAPAKDELYMDAIKSRLQELASLKHQALMETPSSELLRRTLDAEQGKKAYMALVNQAQQGQSEAEAKLADKGMLIKAYETNGRAMIEERNGLWAELAEARKEIERLKQDHAIWATRANDANLDLFRLNNRFEAAAEENAALRKALEAISETWAVSVEELNKFAKEELAKPLHHFSDMAKVREEVIDGCKKDRDGYGDARWKEALSRLEAGEDGK